MIVAVRCRDIGKGASAIDALEQRRVAHPHHIGVLRVGRDVHVVPRTRLDQPVTRLLPPRFPGIVAAEQATIFRFDNREHPVGIRRRHRHADFPNQLRQAVLGTLPRITAIHRLPDPAPRATAAYHPRRALMIPHGRIQNTRVRGVHGEITRATEGVLSLEDLRPRLAAVGGAIDAAITRTLPAIALHRDVHHIGVTRMHTHRGDLSRAGQSHMAPRAPLIGALVHPVAVGGGLTTNRVLTHPHVDHVLVTGRYGNGAHRPGLEESIGDVPPVMPGVVGTPQATARIAGKVHQRLRGNTHRRHGTTATERADIAPRQRRQGGRVPRRSGGDRSGGDRARSLRV